MEVRDFASPSDCLSLAFQFHETSIESYSEELGEDDRAKLASEYVRWNQISYDNIMLNLVDALARHI